MQEFYRGDVCDNIGLMVVYVFRVEVHMLLHHLAVMIQPSGIPVLSPVLFMHVGDPYIPPFLIYLFINVSPHMYLLSQCESNVGQHL